MANIGTIAGKVGTWVASSFCELQPDGTAGKPSFARLSLAVVLTFCLGWVTSILWHTRFQSMPDMSGVIGFISAWGGLVYAPSKVIAAWQARGQHPDGPLDNHDEHR